MAPQMQVVVAVVSVVLLEELGAEVLFCVQYVYTFILIVFI